MKLSPRELEILKLIADGHKRSEITEKLFISNATYGTHRANITQKLEIYTTAGLVKYAVREKLVEL